MKAFSTSLAMGFAALLLCGASANAGLVYLDDSEGNLWVGDPSASSPTYTLVGTSATAAGFGGFTDIGFAAGQLYGLSPTGELYSISTSTGQIIADLGSTGITNGSLVGLSESTGTSIYAGGAGEIYTIIPSVSAQATQVGSGGPYSYTTSGDLDQIGDGSLWLTSTPTAPGNNDELYEISTSTGAILYDAGQLPYLNVFGLAYDSDDNTLYGFATTGEQFDVDTADAALDSDVVTFAGVTDPGNILGAAFVSTPEPASMALIGFGMLGLGLIARKRRAS